MKMFVISLVGAESRRQSMRRQLDALGVDYEIVDAVEGRSLSAADLERVCDFRKMRRLGRVLSPGEIGCALSHLAIYRRIVAERLEAACVLEDDVVLSSDYPELANRAAAFMRGRPGVHLLGEGISRPYGYAGRLGGIYRSTVLKRAYGTFSYVVTREAAMALMGALSPVCRVADSWGVWVGYGLIRLYGINYSPCLLAEGLVESALEVDRQCVHADRPSWFSRRLSRFAHSFWKRYYAFCKE